MLSRLLVGAIVHVACVAAVVGAEPEKKSDVVRLTITPAVEPRPALKFQLLPTFRDRRPGNAAVDYGRAIAQYYQGRGTDAEFEAEWIKWLELPLDEFEKAIQGRNLTPLRETSTLESVRLAARCETCDWQLPLREQQYYLVLLPELQELRQLARLVVLNIRLNVIEGNYDAAIKWLQAGYALARHAAAQPTIVSGLVGVSIAGMMDRARLDWMQRADAPSLYWAETFLPRPLIDSRLGLEAEMYGLTMSFSALNGAKRTPEEWTSEVHKLLRELPSLLAMASSDGQTEKHWSGLLSYVIIMGKVAVLRDDLRDFVVECGLPRSEVEKMNDSQLLLEFTRLKYEQRRDDMFRWMALPYAEARAQLEAAEKQLSNDKKQPTELIPFASVLLPAASHMSHMYARADRRRDVLRIIDALRLHLAANDGKLPKSLGDVTAVPLPKLDPITGKPFVYVLDGDTARLTLPEENRNEKQLLVYELTVKNNR